MWLFVEGMFMADVDCEKVADEEEGEQMAPSSSTVAI
jgi:hypothetical protein